jgi:transcriptional regulator with XRE-family HTH domain
LAFAVEKNHLEGEGGSGMRQRNVTGRGIAYVRSQQNLSQDNLVARLQCDGFDITRDVLANIETGRKRVEDGMLPYFQRALGVPIARFFSQAVRDDDARFAAHPAAGSRKIPLKKCQKLTKRPKEV